jgi:hypothetical protein
MKFLRSMEEKVRANKVKYEMKERVKARKTQNI